MEKVRLKFRDLCLKVDALPCTCLVLMMLATVVNIVARLAFGSSLNGVYETVRYLCLVIVVFAIPYAELDNAMVTVTFLEEWVKPKISNAIRVFWDFVGVIFFGFISYSYILDAQSKYIGNAESSTLHIPTWIPMVFLVICFFLLALVMLIKGICAIQNHKNLPDHRIKHSPDEIVVAEGAEAMQFAQAATEHELHDKHKTEDGGEDI